MVKSSARVGSRQPVPESDSDEHVDAANDAGWVPPPLACCHSRPLRASVTMPPLALNDGGADTDQSAN
jgi:hypothetical protein